MKLSHSEELRSSKKAGDSYSLEVLEGEADNVLVTFSVIEATMRIEKRSKKRFVEKIFNIEETHAVMTYCYM